MSNYGPNHNLVAENIGSMSDRWIVTGHDETDQWTQVQVLLENTEDGSVIVLAHFFGPMAKRHAQLFINTRKEAYKRHAR